MTWSTSLPMLQGKACVAIPHCVQEPFLCPAVKESIYLCFAISARLVQKQLVLKQVCPATKLARSAATALRRILPEVPRG